MIGAALLFALLQSTPNPPPRTGEDGVLAKIIAGVAVPSSDQMAKPVEPLRADTKDDNDEPSSDYAEINGYSVKRNAHDCSLIAIFSRANSSKDASFTLYFDAKLNNAHLAFSDPTVKSIKKQDTKQLKIVLIRQDGSVDSGWGEKEFIATPSEEFGAIFMTRLSDEIVKDVGSAKSIGFFYGDVLLQGFNLSGSAAAVVKLRECSRLQAQVNPSDPFE
jgi:hypothetical protein